MGKGGGHDSLSKAIIVALLMSREFGSGPDGVWI